MDEAEVREEVSPEEIRRRRRLLRKLAVEYAKVERFETIDRLIEELDRRDREDAQEGR